MSYPLFSGRNSLVFLSKYETLAKKVGRCGGMILFERAHLTGASKPLYFEARKQDLVHEQFYNEPTSSPNLGKSTIILL